MELVHKYIILLGTLAISCFVYICFVNYIKATYIHKLRKVEHYDHWFVCLLIFKFCESIVLIYVFGINNNIYLYHTFFFMISKYSHSLYLLIFILKISEDVYYPRFQKILNSLIVMIFLLTGIISLTAYVFEDGLKTLQEPYIVSSIGQMLNHVNLFNVLNIALGSVLVMSTLVLILCIKNENIYLIKIISCYIVTNLFFAPVIFQRITNIIYIESVEIGYVVMSCVMYYFINKTIPKKENGGLDHE